MFLRIIVCNSLFLNNRKKILLLCRRFRKLLNSMAGNALRREVLRAFKQLHGTRRKVFRDDDMALSAARTKINEEFKKNKGVKDLSAVHEMLVFANAVEEELRTSVIQAVETKPGTYEVRITKDTLKLENMPFREAITDTVKPGPAKDTTKKKTPTPSETLAAKQKAEKARKSQKTAKVSP